jgi:hypothetical protein
MFGKIPSLNIDGSTTSLSNSHLRSNTQLTFNNDESKEQLRALVSNTNSQDQLLPSKSELIDANALRKSMDNMLA